MKSFSIIKINIIFIAVLFSVFLFVSFASADETPAPETPAGYYPQQDPSTYSSATPLPSGYYPQENPSAYPSSSSSPTSTSDALSTSGTQLNTISEKWPPLADALNPQSKGGGKTEWIFTIWNVCLGLVNIVVAGILIFLAFVNILRIQIDTYALKKILPTLIIAVVLANFSMLICRMVVDFSDALTKTFAENPSELAQNLQSSLGAISTGSSIGVLGSNVVTFFLTPVITLVALLVSFILAVIPSIGVLILAFLLYIRTGIIYVLVAASPLAFICMALPATQGIFRQWWSQFARWVFMAPIVFFLLKIASMVKSDTFSLWAYVISLGMLYLAIQVPFKMGGVVMSVWGGLGKRIGAWGTKQGFRAADTSFGQAMQKLTGKYITPAGVYEAVKRGRETDWQKRLASSTQEGAELVEGVTGMPGRAWHAVKTKDYEALKNVWQPSISTTAAGFKMEIDPHLKNAQNLRGLDETVLNKQFESAIKLGNESEAKDIFLAKGMQGNLTDKNVQDFSKKFDPVAKKTNGAEVSAITYALISAAENSSKGTGNPIINPYQLDQRRRRGVPGGFEATTNKIKKGLADEFDEFSKNSDLPRMTNMVNRSLGFIENVSRADYKPDNEAHLRFLREVIKNQPTFIQQMGNKDKVIAEVDARPELKVRFDQGIFDIPAIGTSPAKRVSEQIKDSLSNLMYNPINLNVPIGAKAEYVLKNIDEDTGMIKNDVDNALKRGYKNLDNELKKRAGRPMDDIILTKDERVNIIETLSPNIKKDIKDRHEILQRMEKGIKDIEDITGRSKVKGIKDLIKKFKKRGV